MNQQVIIFAAGGPLTADLEETSRRNDFQVVAAILNRGGRSFFSDNQMSVDVSEIPSEFKTIPFLCPLFTPSNRRVAVAEAVALGLRPAAAVVDATAILPASIQLGDGSYINAGCILGSVTRLGQHVIVNRGASVGHHGDIGDFVSIGPGAVIAGQVQIGNDVLIGAGAVVEPGLTIGAGSVVAAGAVLRRDLPPGAVATGNPARISRAFRRIP